MARARLAVALVVVAGCGSPDALDGWPAELVVRSPGLQAGLTGYSVNDLPAVELRDADGKPIAGAPITFTATSGGGSVTGGIATTGDDGIATVGAWSLGAGANLLTATIPAPFRVPSVQFGASGLQAAFQINLVYLTPISPSRQAVFQGAATRWQQMVFGDIADITVNIPDSLCFTEQPAIVGTIDDLMIHVILDSIDGPGFILGGAAPCFIRSAGKLPLHGVMIFDTADVAMLETEGLFDEVILHEMGHVLGFGTLWAPAWLNLLVGGGGGDPSFIGPNARTAFERLGGATYSGGAKVPVENSGGGGTRDVHWRESVFDNELMTGYLNAGVANPLSFLSVAAMRDEGYQANYAAADVYTHPFSVAPPLAPSVTTGPKIALGDDVLRLPLHTVDARGRLTLVREP